MNLIVNMFVWQFLAKVTYANQNISVTDKNINSTIVGQSSNLCNLDYTDSTAHVSIENKESMDTDKASLVSYGPRSVVIIDRQSVIQLRQQSGLRILARGQLHTESYSNISACESGHMTIIGRTNMSNSAKLHLEASRALIAGESALGPDVTVFLYDSSVLRVYEGGFFVVGPSGIIALYRGASLEVSEWWQHALLGDIRAWVELGRGFRASLLDRSSLQVAKGRLHTGPNVVFTMYKQSSLWLKGRLNVSESSSITIGERGRLVIGTEGRLDYRAHLAPSLAFGLPSIRLEIKDDTALIVKPGAHCLLLKSLTVNETMTLDCSTVKLPYVVCYTTPYRLIEAAYGVSESRTLCIRV